jgi:hypothetical protein
MVNVQLGELACRGLEGHFGPDLAIGARKALVHYAYKLRVGRPPLSPPGFVEEPAAAREVAVDLDAESAALLEREALRQRVDLGRLAAHAVLVYLAELEFLGVGRSPSADGERRR